MEKQEEESPKYIEKGKGSSSILEKIDEICEQYRNENENINKEIAPLDKWSISDFFGLNDLEKIKRTPEYIVEKVLIKFKNFLNFNEYFFIMKQKESEENTDDNEKENGEENQKKSKNINKSKLKETKVENKIEEKKEIKSKENNMNKKNKGKVKKSSKEKIRRTENENFEEKESGKKTLEKKNKNREKEKEKRNKEEMKKESNEVKKYKMKSPNEKRSNSINNIPSLDSYKYNLSMHDEEEYEKIYNFKSKRANSLFYKRDINNNILNKKIFSDSSDSKKLNKLINEKKDFNDSLSNSKNKVESNSSHFSFKKDSSLINKININSSSNELLSNIKDNSSKRNNKLDNKSSSFSSKNYTSSIFYNFQYSESKDLTNISEKKNKEKNDKKANIDVYKLKFFKNKLNLEEGENLSGKSYEDYARKIVKLMFILSLKIVPDFKNPQSISTNNLINFYKSLLELGKIKSIDTPIGSSIFEEIKKHLEIDIAFELKKKDIMKFVHKYDKIIFFQNHFLNENDENMDVEATCYMEIARNLISQGKEKLEQIKKYIKIIKIMNNMIDLFSNKKYKKILRPYKTPASTEKIFSIITDGNFEELKFVIDKIIIPKLNREELIYEDIKKYIEKNLNDNPNLFKNVENKESLIDNIYYVLEIFYQLKINEIKFCLIYIGEICESKYELTNILTELNNAHCLNEKGKELLNNFAIKKRDRLIELKDKYQEIKNIIHEFEKKCEQNIVFNKEEIDKIFSKINFDIFDLDDFISKNKYEFNTYIFYNKKDGISSLQKEYEDIIEYFKKYFKFKIKESEISKKKLDNIFNYIRQDKNTIFFLILEDKNISTFFPYCLHLTNIFIFQINNKGSRKVPLDPKYLIEQMNIASKFRDKINQDIKKNLPYYSDEQMLMPTNLENKLSNDLNKIFKVKESKEINIKDFIEKVKFDIPKEKEDELIKYFDEISKIFIIKDNSEIKKIFITNLNKLIQNVLSKHFYFIFIHKIGKNFREKYIEELTKSLDNFNKS